MKPISVVASSSISSLGHDSRGIWDSYLLKKHFLTYKKFKINSDWVADVHLEEIASLQRENPKYKHLDKSVLLAIFSARKAIKKTLWQGNFAINIGSSRGATSLFEKFHKAFLQNPQNKVATLTSPTTTLGNIASWVAQDVQSTSGVYISHSITCSTALHSLLNAIAWLNAGMKKKFLVGGSEAANTPFTIAQMKALKVYSTLKKKEPYPCLANHSGKSSNTMVLGEGAAMFCLEKGLNPNAKALIVGIGYATEPLTHNISISTDAVCFQTSMKMALQSAKISKVDGIVMHAPGTIKGDRSELIAIEKIFKDDIPLLTTNKWKIGHTLGASGALSIDFALQMLKHQIFIHTPFDKEFIVQKSLNTLMVNAVGFGANAVSIIFKRI